MKRVFALVLIAALTPMPALAQQAAGIVTTLDGSAKVVRAATPSGVDLKFKDDVFVRDRITTGQESLVKMFLGGKAVVTVRELSALTITEDVNKTAISLDGNGKVRIALVKARLKPGESYEIRTPNAIASVRGSAAIVELAGNTTHIDAEQGDVRGGLLVGPLIQIPPGQGLTIVGNVLGSLRPFRPDARAGLLGKGRPGQGPKTKPDPNALQTDLSSLGGGSGTGMPGSPETGSGARVLPANPKSGIYVP